MKKAILQVADTGPLESLVLMLRAVGYECFLPNDALKREIRACGCDTVLDIGGLVTNWGYDWPMDLKHVGPEEMLTTDLYVDVKAQRNAEKVWKKWPNLQGKTLWYRINGGEPCIVPGCGDEINPPCPVLTPDIWYGEPGPWQDKSYACWPPFYRFHDYYTKHGRPDAVYAKAVCLTHNLGGWNHLGIYNKIKDLLLCYGVSSPNGLIKHKEVPAILSNAIALVHLKSSDAPGYSLYEAIAAECPVIVSRTLIWANRMEELFIPGETCLAYDIATYDGFDEARNQKCAEEILEHLKLLNIPDENRRIAKNARKKLVELMWDANRQEDVASLCNFMERMYP